MLETNTALLIVAVLFAGCASAGPQAEPSLTQRVAALEAQAKMLSSRHVTATVQRAGPSKQMHDLSTRVETAEHAEGLYYPDRDPLFLIAQPAQTVSEGDSLGIRWSASFGSAGQPLTEPHRLMRWLWCSLCFALCRCWVVLS